MRFLALTLFTFLTLTGGVFAMKPLFEIKTPYAFATSASQKNGAVFFKIHNHGDEALKIVSAASDVANRVELHTHEMDGDMMMMREVESYDIAAHGSLTLKPMAEHVMLIGLKAPLKQGETFEVVLNTQDNGDLRVQVEVVEAGVIPEDASDHGHGHDHHHGHGHHH